MSKIISYLMLLPQHLYSEQGEAQIPVRHRQMT